MSEVRSGPCRVHDRGEVPRQPASVLRPALALALVLTCVSAVSGAADRPCVRLEPLNASAARDTLSEARIDLLEKLNRRDRRYLWRLDSLVVPCTWDLDELEYSPLPRNVARFEEAAKTIVVDQAWQVFGGYEKGVLVRWGPVSTGRRADPTPPGLHHLTWRSSGRHSTVDADWYMPWYFNFHNQRGLSFHQYALPGRPASHACVRLLERDARWLYGWGESWQLDARRTKVLEHGTPVLIVGHYDFDVSPPWRSPEEVARGITLRVGAEGGDDLAHVVQVLVRRVVPWSVSSAPAVIFGQSWR